MKKYNNEKIVSLEEYRAKKENIRIERKELLQLIKQVVKTK